ncbi:SlyX family protein [Bdellovibrio reynosensis]|uniref:SlyX family protein n=1 Tax=Bdellovibrio reynosensis TaxID=2835041 RepID=A0ABY4CDF0_9BACT|nr:SlyX family protein [Bdellovibrio reynosensis]UOF01892.1 SlyX family protein [Bdellovibrio reynosensis]
MSEERLIDIETKILHQEHLIEELNQVVYSQQKTIDKLETLLTGLTKRLKEALGGESDDIRPNEKPPHY